MPATTLLTPRTILARQFQSTYRFCRPQPFIAFGTIDFVRLGINSAVAGDANTAFSLLASPLTATTATEGCLLATPNDCERWIGGGVSAASTTSTAFSKAFAFAAAAASAFAFAAASSRFSFSSSISLLTVACLRRLAPSFIKSLHPRPHRIRARHQLRSLVLDDLHGRLGLGLLMRGRHRNVFERKLLLFGVVIFSIVGDGAGASGVSSSSAPIDSAACGAIGCQASSVQADRVGGELILGNIVNALTKLRTSGGRSLSASIAAARSVSAVVDAIRVACVKRHTFDRSREFEKVPTAAPASGARFRKSIA